MRALLIIARRTLWCITITSLLGGCFGMGGGQAFPPVKAILKMADLPLGYTLDAGPGKIPGDGETGDYSSVRYASEDREVGITQSVYNYGTILEAQRLYAGRAIASHERDWPAWLSPLVAAHADEKYLTCLSHCSSSRQFWEYRARYREYVVMMRVNLMDPNLTQSQFGDLIALIDARMSTLLKEHPIGR